MKTKVLIGLVMAAMAWTATAYGQGGPGGPGGPGRPGGPPPPVPKAVQPPPPAERVDDLAQMLNLTAKQAADLKAVLESVNVNIQPLMKAANDANRAVREAFVAVNFTTAGELAKTAAGADLALTNASLAAWSHIQASRILTADQFAKLLAGPGRPGGPPPAGPPAGSFPSPQVR